MKKSPILDKLKIAAAQHVKEKNYWMKKFSGNPEKTSFPHENKTGNGNEENPGILTFRFNRENGLQVIKLSNQSDIRIYMILTAGLVALLYRTLGTTDIILGMPIYKQDTEGDYINGVLALRNRLKEPMTSRELLNEVRQTIIEAVENQDYPIEVLVEDLDVSKEEEGFPLFDIVILLENIHDKRYIQHIHPHITFSFNRTNEYITGVLEYNPILYSKAAVNRILDHLEHLLVGMSGNLDLLLTGIEILSGEEKKQILYDFNDTERDYPTDVLIHQLFEKQVEKTPDHVALVGKDEGWKGGKVEGKKENILITYGELNKKVGQLARLLQEKGSQPDTVVGVMMERSVEMVTGIFGILKAGAAYLPIDPEYPEERIQYILKDSSAKILVTVPGLSGKFEKLSIVNCQLLMVNESPPNRRRLNNPPKEANSIINYQLTIHNSQLNSSNLAYIIYTSGSTGKPKGVMIRHRSVINLLYGQSQLYPLVESDRYLLKTAYSFDVSVTELFGWTLAGGALVLLEKGGEKDPARIIDTTDRENITHINFVPTMFFAFSYSLRPWDIPKLSSLKYIFLAGEELKGEVFSYYKNEKTTIKFVNLYGPTEGTVYASGYAFTLMDHVEKIPIGKPLPNVKLFILDRWGNFQPVGVGGELCISGAGVARGYLNQPELTIEKFRRAVIRHSSFVISSSKRLSKSTNDQCPMTNDRSHKFSPNDHSPQYPITPLPHHPIYLTGDLSRWLPDGNIEFLGRMDNQVKIRGFRIELEEIESQLLRYQSIKEAVVLLQERNDHRFLSAYIIPGQAFDKTGLKDYLSSVLPAYMIPSYFIPLEKFPLTSSGKIDRNTLPAPEVGVSEKYVPPGNEMEKKLCEIWSEILGIKKEKIGTENNFFELGGNSVKLIMMVSRINNVFETEVPISQIYNKPLIKDISKSLISGNISHQQVVLLNRLKQKKIFCFPPQIGYGYSYTNLASLIHDYSFYGLTFIEDEDRLQQYVDLITDLQPVGPYIFMGHSAAGRLAFQVTKTLENQGRGVSDIIFCDCFFSGDAPDFSDKKYEGYMKQYYKHIDDILETWNVSFLKEEVIQKSNNYMNYCYNVTHLEKVNANIHLIRSQEAREYAMEDWHWDPNCWNDLTGKRYRIYEGWGEHGTMLDFGALEKNVGIIRKILDKIDHERQDTVYRSDITAGYTAGDKNFYPFLKNKVTKIH